MILPEANHLMIKSQIFSSICQLAIHPAIISLLTFPSRKSTYSPAAADEVRDAIFKVSDYTSIERAGVGTPVDHFTVHTQHEDPIPVIQYLEASVYIIGTT